jgi:hypothetical protein
MLLSEDEALVFRYQVSGLRRIETEARGRRNISVLRVSILPQIATGLGYYPGVCILGDRVRMGRHGKLGQFYATIAPQSLLRNNGKPSLTGIVKWCKDSSRVSPNCGFNSASDPANQKFL